MIKFLVAALADVKRRLQHCLSLCVVLSCTFALPAQAQISQVPLLTQSGSVEPNLMLMFDDSLSMVAQFIYQYGGQDNGYGRTGPGTVAAAAACPVTSPASTGVSCAGSSGANYPSNPSITVTGTYTAPPSFWYWEMSPDVNGLYYDPRVTYNPRLDALGAYSTPGTTSTTAFNVYFYRNSSGNNVTWPGSGPNPTTTAAFFDPYTPATSVLAPDAQPLLSYPRGVSSTTGPFPKFLNRTDCTGTNVLGANCTLADERQNYANWKKYHSNRMDAAKTGLGYAFQNMTQSIRLGWSTINNLKSLSAVDSGVGLYTQAQKNAFYQWLYALDTSSGGTPSHFALDNVGKYFSRSDNYGPWATTPVTTSTGITTLALTTTDTVAIRASHFSCRRSFAMLTTDGYYNDGSAGGSPFSGLGNIDGTSAGPITGTTATGSTLTYSYSGSSKPYSDSQSNTLADIAMKYWITDLRTDLPNRVKQIQATVISGNTTTVANESFWQNMSFYAVGFGVSGTLLQTATTLASLTSGGTSWPTVGDEDTTAVDDLWHATINTRSKILSAKNAGTLNDAVEGMLADINRNTSSQSGVAASTLSLTNGTRKYTPKFTTGDWTGNVIATALDPSSSAEISITWQVVDTNPITSATYNGIPGYSSRNIYAWNGSAMGNFNALNTYVMSNVVGANTNLINYLRGDRTNEDPNGTALYRARKFLLGDIVNSSPVFIRGALNSSYDQLPSGTYGQSTYAAFVTSKAARAEGVLFAGANDGMLHGFRDSNGTEIFAYVPRAVMPKLHLLASRSYDHQYYVDGPNVEADACLSGGSGCTTWSNLLIGTAGAGAKTVYALDVTDPINMSASSVKWEITPSTPGYASLGYILTDVQTGLTKSGEWVAIFGNGYYGSSTMASLYVANLDTGALIKQISTGVGGSNGLGGVRVVRDSNQRIIGAYAGDARGNLWKFDLSSASSAGWGLGLSNSPLYSGTTTKSITAQPTVVANPNGGNVIVFGTGKLYDATDVTNTVTQTMYGIWDSVSFGSSTTPLGVTQTGVSSLVQQTISTVATTGTKIVTASNLSTSTVTVNYYTVSTNSVDFATKRGWYMNLPNTGQRSIYSSEALVSGYVLLDTVSPSNVSLDPCIQTGSGRAWNYVIDGVTGSGPTTAIFDTNGDGIINTSDVIVAGYENTADGRTRVIKNDSKSDSTGTYYNPLSTEQQPGFRIRIPPQVFNPLTNISNIGGGKRSWRQLFPR
ncbi:MAG: PilC/PilY family type IV pilus protein [Pseudomonadota bacterium]